MLRVPMMVALSLLAVVVLALRSQTPALAQAPGVPSELTVPDPVAVSLDGTTTAFLAIDLLDACGAAPNCVAILPAVAGGLASARAAHALVVYSTHLAPDTNILPDVAPMPSDSIFAAFTGDKFFDSNLDNLLRHAGTTTLIITGTLSNSGVMYTAAGAIQRGYTVVVAVDGISAPTGLATPVALWEMLHAPVANPQNVPLQANAVTLSRTNLITYK